MQNIINAINELAKVRGCKFISLTYKAKGTGEIARHSLLFGVNIEKAYKADLAKYKRLLGKSTGFRLLALQELIKSLEESLIVGIGNNSAYTCKDTYEYILPGVKTHLATNELYINGFSRGKVVLKAGEYPSVKSSEKTVAKNTLRKLGKLGSFRQFVLKAENIGRVAVNGKVLTIEQIS